MHAAIATICKRPTPKVIDTVTSSTKQKYIAIFDSLASSSFSSLSSFSTRPHPLRIRRNLHHNHRHLQIRYHRSSRCRSNCCRRNCRSSQNLYCSMTSFANQIEEHHRHLFLSRCFRACSGCLCEKLCGSRDRLSHRASYLLPCQSENRWKRCHRSQLSMYLPDAGAPCVGAHWRIVRLREEDCRSPGKKDVLCTSTWEITILGNGIRKNPLPFLLLAPLPVSKFHLPSYGQYG